VVKTAASTLDTARIRKLYMESEFDHAIGLLEKDLKGKPSLTHADSVFIYKYLAVMYTSKYESRELGKRYMYQLLAIEPSARISDMFASDMIYMIFKNVQDEYFAMHPQDGPPPPPPHKETSRSSGHTAWYWVGGAVLVLTAGVTAYVILDDAPSKKVAHPVPAEPNLDQGP
jgi:hypothetical protein